jgi:membrane protease YdiL (CAAX protease family)
LERSEFVKPIHLPQVVLIFVGTLIPILIGVYVVLPALVAKGMPFLVGYLLCFQTIPFAVILSLAIVLFRLEGNPFSWNLFKTRMRLNLNGRSVLFGLALLVVGLAAYLLLQSVTKRLARIPVFAPPDWFAPDLHPLKVGQPGSFMGMPLAGVYWVPVVYLAGWFLNIAGEELLFRGYLMPRMELSFAGSAWIVNALCWWVWHSFWRWQLVALAPIIFLLPLAAQRSKSTVPGMLSHGIMNLVGVVITVILVFR